mgnify:CR=1 FL=1
MLSLFKKDKLVIEIYDTSSIDFFLDPQTLTNKDPRLLCTIVDANLPRTNNID